MTIRTVSEIEFEIHSLFVNTAVICGKSVKTTNFGIPLNEFDLIYMKLSM